MRLDPRGIALASVLALLAWLPVSAPAQTPTPAVPADQGPSDDAVLARAKEVFRQAQTGRFDRTLLSDKLDMSLDDEAVSALVSQLKPLGTPVSFQLESKTGIDMTTVYVFAVTFKSAVIEETLTLDSNDKISSLAFKPPQ